MKRVVTVRVTQKDPTTPNTHTVLLVWSGELDFDPDRFVGFLEGRRLRKPKAKEAAT